MAFTAGRRAEVMYRLAEARDASTLADLLCEHISFIWDGRKIAPSERSAMENFYGRMWNDQSTLIAVKEGEDGKVLATGTVGIVRGMPSASRNKYARIGFITDITVSVSQRGQGLGSDIFKYLLRLCRDRQVSYLILTANDSGARVYRKFGFSYPLGGSVAMETHITTFPLAIQPPSEKLNGFIFRFATSLDRCRIIDFRKVLVQRSGSCSEDDFDLSSKFYLEEWEPSNPLVALAEDRVTGNVMGMAAVGFGAGTMYGSEFPTKDNYLTGFGYVFDVFVEETFRRRGIGCALLSSLLTRLQELDIGYLILSANEDAVKFFQKFMFVVASEADSFGLEATWDAYSSTL